MISVDDRWEGENDPVGVIDHWIDRTIPKDQTHLVHSKHVVVQLYSCTVVHNEVNSTRDHI